MKEFQQTNIVYDTDVSISGNAECDGREDQEPTTEASGVVVAVLAVVRDVLREMKEEQDQTHHDFLKEFTEGFEAIR